MRYFTVRQTREVRIATADGVLGAAQTASKLFAGEKIEDESEARGPIVDRKLEVEECR